MLSNSDLFCTSKILTQQEAKGTALDGHTTVGKLMPVLAQEHLKRRAACADEPFGSFPSAPGSAISVTAPPTMGTHNRDPQPAC